MELRDLIVTPIVILLVYFGAYLLRPFCTDTFNRKYFLPGLTVKIIGALAVGFIYQFYYNGGDTYNYHTHGSRHVWEAFMDTPEKGIKLLVNDQSDFRGVNKYATRIAFLNDPQSFVIVRIAAVCDLITFSAYSATAVFFAVFAFVGSWLLFLTFYRLYPTLHKGIAVATLFIPSVFFWGSGLLKDTITLSCVGIATFCIYKLLIQKKFSAIALALLVVSLYLLYSIKIYILLTFLPAAILWVFIYSFSTIRSAVMKMLLFPFVIGSALGLAYFAMVKAGEDNPKYSIDALAKTAQVTAYDIRYWSGRDAGSGYSLGELDGSWQSMLRLGPEAMNVSLFRPYLWEVRNPLMLLSALESFLLLALTLYVIFKTRFKALKALDNPSVVFCLVFSLSFAFAVGVSTFNFGTLMRYKIPLLPFYSLALVLMFDQANKARKLSAFDTTA